MYDVIRSITDHVQLIRFNNQALILKTYKDCKAKADIIKFINILDNHNLPTLQYLEFEWLEDNQLCLNFIPKFHTFDKKKSTSDYALVGKYIRMIHCVLETGIGNLDNCDIMLANDHVYFLNPSFETTKSQDIDLFLKNNLSKSKHFQTSLNQQETKQNEFLDAFLNQ